MNFYNLNNLMKINAQKCKWFSGDNDNVTVNNVVEMIFV